MNEAQSIDVYQAIYGAQGPLPDPTPEELKISLGDGERTLEDDLLDPIEQKLRQEQL